MERPASDVVFSPAVKAIQSRMGSREAYARREARGAWATDVTPELAAFIAARDFFYFGTAGNDGQPYIQHRGGAPGFLKIVGPRTLAFADFTGNRQYISVGNLSENPKSTIFLMDYANQRRIKLWGRARAVEDDGALLSRLTDGEEARAERAIVFDIEAWDVNCPKHIRPRYTEEEVRHTHERLLSRLTHLEAENAQLRQALADRG